MSGQGEHPDHPPVPGGYRGPTPITKDEARNRAWQQLRAVMHDFDYGRLSIEDVVRELRRVP